MIALGHGQFHEWIRRDVRLGVFGSKCHMLMSVDELMVRDFRNLRDG